MSYQENIRAFGSDVAAPPPYEEAVRSSALLPVSAARIRGLGPENALRVLAADPNVDRRRIRLDELQVERQLPMTTLQTDSYIARYKGQQVLVKRLAPGQAINVPAVEDLAVEIQQRSHLKHPNLVQFVCAGWTSALDLAMGVEFLAQGSLRTYLDPELDTCESPYYDARSPDGSTLDQEAVLAIVAEGRLRPSFSAECPTFIRQLGVACCQQDPEKRLTAQQIVQLLEGK
ncbi:uncharacterized protein KRP23_2951 [Phytophthora ramorum]|uniref:uncharacterized protein n=1 Tax=Phytophthora ramorum TaxID=164328 RepID=UPI00309B33D4|nr:hypothetical protein KRP23_2951 [Phytophthora ramorum]